MKTDTIFDVKQYIIDIPSSSQESCFNILRHGVVLDVFLPVGELEGIEEDPVLDLVYAAYSETEAKRHLIKVRETLGFSNDSGTDGTRSYPVIGTGSSNFYSIKDLHIPAEEQIAVLEANPFTPEQLRTPLPSSELIAPSAPQQQHAVKALNLSHWNPPPAHLQLKGHLFYIQVTTLEGHTYHITANTAGFYVSNTSGDKFDASPRLINGKVLQNHSLLSLIRELSPASDEAAAKNALKFKDIEPHSYLKPTNTFFASPWIVNLPTSIQPDLSKTQDSLYANETLVTGLKDWNEEFQSSRELERNTIQERIIRERLLNKLSFEFAEAATKGTISILKGNVTALNSDEPIPTQIFLHNGIFYSYGADGAGVYAENGGDAAARYTVGKEPLGANILNKLDIDGLCPLATTVVDFCGRRVLAQTPVPGIFRQSPEGESQIVYGSIENKESVVADEKFAPIMKTVGDACHVQPHTVFDNSGNAVELLSASSINGLMGTDRRKYILDLHKITPLDLGFYEDIKDSETEYPHTVGTLRSEAVEEWWRIKARELMSVKLDAKRAEAEKNAPPKEEAKEEPKEETKDESKEETEGEEKPEEVKEEVKLTQEENQAVVVEASEKYRVNPDVPLDISTIPEGPVREAYEKDAEVIRYISNQIKTLWIPNLITELKDGTLGVPFDGTQLTSLLHRRGINMRYLGLIAELSAKEGASLEVFHSLVVREIVARSVKHIIGGILKEFPVEFAPQVVPHYFNCLLGYKINAKPEAALDPLLTSLYPTVDTSVLNEITVESVRAEISAVALSRFRFDLGQDWISSINPLPLFREISIKNGFQWRGRNYDFTATEVSSKDTSASSSSKKSKKNKKTAALQKPTAPVLFTSEDFLNIVPIIKFSTFRSQLAEEALESGRLSILQGDTEVGLELLTESLTLHEHVYGLIHPETARTYSQLALVYNELKNMEMACDYGRKAVIIQERCHGVDSAETMFVYLNLALFEHTNNNTVGALSLIRHAFKYWSSICSPYHPDSITTMNNVATMLQNLKLHSQAVQWYEASRELTLKVYGSSSPNLAALNYQISQSQVVLQEYSAAVESMRESHRIFSENFGPDDVNTKETKTWLDQLVAVAVNIAKQVKNAEQRANASGNAESPEAAVAAAAAAASASRKARLQHARGASHHVGGASNGGVAAAAQPSATAKTALGSKSINELVDYINGTSGSGKSSKSKKKAAAAAAAGGKKN